MLRAVTAALGRQAATETAPMAIPAAPAALTQEAAILVAEDNAINRLVLGKQLRQLGYPCDMAEHGEAAWALLQEKPYRLLLTDCIMPVLDGYDLARRIRRQEAHEGGPHLPIVALTANVMEGEQDKCRLAGMDDYVSKPLALERLSALLQKIFAGDMSAVGAALEPDPIDWAGLGEILGSSDLADLQEVAGFFAESFGGLLDKLHEAIESGDPAQVRVAAHTAKGAARNGAAPRLAELMAALEQDAKEGRDRGHFIAHAEAADREFARLRQWLEVLGPSPR
jgi:CheY-like chemotaxis protein